MICAALGFAVACALFVVVYLRRDDTGAGQRDARRGWPIAVSVFVATFLLLRALARACPY